VAVAASGCRQDHLIDEPHVPNQLVVQWTQPVSAPARSTVAGRRVRRGLDHDSFDQEAQLLLKDQGFRAVRQLRDGRVWLVRSAENLTRRQLIAKARQIASKQELVDWVAANSRVYFQQSLTGTPASVNDPEFASQWALQPGKLDAPGAWNITQGSRAAIVAVVDTGVDDLNPDIGCNLWVNPCEDLDRDGDISPAEQNGVDDACAGESGGNGATDDFHGWNFIDLNGDLSDQTTHGTSVAGIAGACTGNAIGIAGLAAEVSLAIVKVGHSYMSDIVLVADGIDYAVEIGADVINASFTTVNHPLLETAIQNAGSHGAMVTAAAGDETQYAGVDLGVFPKYPAAYAFPNVIAVTSTTDSDQLAPLANFGASVVELGAPGVGIKTTAGAGYFLRSGTSMAAPHVAGVIALLRALDPAASVDRIRECLAHGDPVSALSGITEWGVRLNARRALEACHVEPSPSGVGQPGAPTLLGD